MRDVRGNIAMMTALASVPLITLLGGAVDMARMNQTRSEIQSAVDAGVLAISEIGNKNDPETTIRQFITANLHSSIFDPDNLDLDVEVSDTLNGKTVRVDVNYPMKTYFLGLIGMGTMDIKLSSAGTQTFSDLEIAIVLDISGSMNGTKFTNMKSAAKEFVDTVLTSDVRDKTTISIVPFATSVNVGDNFKKFVKSSDLDNNHDTWFSDGHIWDGCVEFGSGDFNDSRPASNSLMVMPRFTDDTYSSLYHCPESNNEVLYLSNTKKDLKDKIDDLSISRNTGLNIGATVGLKVLSPEMKGHLKGDQQAKHPAPYDNGTMKALIIMTDGEVTEQKRPYDGCDALRVASWNRWGNFYWENCQYAKYTASTARSKFTEVCNLAKSRGIMIYTIGFQINKGANSDQIMEDCASSASQYYYVEDTDISAAFRSIAASINGVRLTL